MLMTIGKNEISVSIITVLLLVSLFALAEIQNNMTNTIKATVGKEFIITLDGNATTGYQWQLASSIDDSLVKFVSSEYVPDKTGLTGSGGKSIWTFKAVRAGKAQVSFQYVRPWEKDTPPAKQATYIIVIQG